MIRLATHADLPELHRIYAAARAFMKANGNPNQWKDGHPSDAFLTADIANGILYVAEDDGVPYGAFVLAEGPDPTYSRIDGEGWRSQKPYGVIHKVASDGTHRGFLHMVVSYAKERYSHLRIDTHEHNLPMQNGLAKEGFAHRGTIYLQNGDPRLAFDLLGMQRVIVIGCPGGGKSTFARALRDRTGLPLYCLDMIWHKPDKTTVTREEFDASLQEILQKDRYLIDGNYARTLEARLASCDTAVLLDYPLEVCLSGVEARIGTKREDMPWVEEEFDPEFREWIINFGRDKLPYIYECLSRARGVRVLIFRSRDEAARFLEDV